MRAAMVGLVLLVGCAPKLYGWGDYDDALYEHYKNPQERERFVAALAVVITDAERQGLRVPPGCYAEYGWALYEEGRRADAVPYFQKEIKHWPESRVLMEKLIRNANRSTVPAPAVGPAGTIEEGRK